jgi:hypothetical protein
MTREQCEEAVNYRGFCVTDSNVPRAIEKKSAASRRRPSRLAREHTESGLPGCAKLCERAERKAAPQDDGGPA